MDGIDIVYNLFSKEFFSIDKLNLNTFGLYQMTFKLCYVTAFLDLGRESWQNFSRTFDDYYQSFLPLLEMFKNLTDNKDSYRLIIYIDKKHSEKIKKDSETLHNITIIEIDQDFLYNNSPLWRRLNRETEIMNSDAFKNLINSCNRSKFPEHTNPKYTLINHAKIDLVNHAMSLTDCYYFCWVDFGYFADSNRIPNFPLDLNKFNLDKINYTLINPIDQRDKDVLYTLTNAPEKIGGFFFLGSRKTLPVFQKIFHIIHQAFQDANIADDDQHIVLQAYFYRPELFELHNLGGWHRALTHFQADNNKALFSSSLTEIMNRNGSDKGSGHHNYTIYYEKLFKPIREEKMNILEIGIGTNDPNIPSSMCGTVGGYTPGSSLRGWREYFYNSTIYGCDIDRKILFQTDQIQTFYLDQTDNEEINKQIVQVDRMYDLIIDDGLHDFRVNWNLMKQIFVKLNKGGFYVIEDICNFNPDIIKDTFMDQIEFKYFILPNPQNPADNNIVVARWKGEKIPELINQNSV